MYGFSVRKRSRETTPCSSTTSDDSVSSKRQCLSSDEQDEDEESQNEELMKELKSTEKRCFWQKMVEDECDSESECSDSDSDDSDQEDIDAAYHYPRGMPWLDPELQMTDDQAIDQAPPAPDKNAPKGGRNQVSLGNMLDDIFGGQVVYEPSMLSEEEKERKFWRDMYRADGFVPGVSPCPICTWTANPRRAMQKMSPVVLGFFAIREVNRNSRPKAEVYRDMMNYWNQQFYRPFVGDRGDEDDSDGLKLTISMIEYHFRKHTQMNDPRDMLDDTALGLKRTEMQIRKSGLCVKKTVAGRDVGKRRIDKEACDMLVKVTRELRETIKMNVQIDQRWAAINSVNSAAQPGQKRSTNRSAVATLLKNTNPLGSVVQSQLTDS